MVAKIPIGSYETGHKYRRQAPMSCGASLPCATPTTQRRPYLSRQFDVAVLLAGPSVRPFSPRAIKTRMLERAMRRKTTLRFTPLARCVRVIASRGGAPRLSHPRHRVAQSSGERRCGRGDRPRPACRAARSSNHAGSAVGTIVCGYTAQPAGPQGPGCGGARMCVGVAAVAAVAALAARCPRCLSFPPFAPAVAVAFPAPALLALPPFPPVPPSPIPSWRCHLLPQCPR